MDNAPSHQPAPSVESINAAQPKAAAMQGWMNKQNHKTLKKYQKFWFELWGPELRYFEQEGSKIATRIIVVNGCNVPVIKGNRMFLDTPNDSLQKSYVFSCSKPAELEKWREALAQASSLPKLVKPLAAQQRVSLVALVNSKSGGKQGVALKDVLAKHLGSNSVFDLANGGPQAGIREHIEHEPNTRFIVCGGDGTVGWTLQDVDKLRESGVLGSVNVPVAVLPLGTGNDLARTLQCGGGYTGQKMLPILNNAATADVTLFDRWRVVIDCNAAGGAAAGGGEASKMVLEKLMCNYTSVGYDARVARLFHVKRETKPHLFKNRSINKAWYAWYGLRNLSGQLDLAKALQLRIDGHEVKIPASVRAIAVINIPSYSGGANLWGKAKTEAPLQLPSISDGLLEVVGTYGTVHSLGIMMGVRRADRLGQGKDIEILMRPGAITAKDPPLYAQVDGEPYLLDAGGVHEDAAYDAAHIGRASPGPPAAFALRVTAHTQSALVRNERKPTGCCGA